MLGSKGKEETCTCTCTYLATHHSPTSSNDSLLIMLIPLLIPFAAYTCKMQCGQSQYNVIIVEDTKMRKSKATCID